MDNKIWQIIDIINWAKEYLAKHKIDSPRLTIELILCYVLGLERVQLYTQYEKPLSDSELAKVKEMIQLRIKRYPLQYILGYVEFMGFKFEVNEDVLIPRPETEELVAEVIKAADTEKELKILDIGTGSGCIAIALGKLLPNATITAVDNSTSALKVAKLNSTVLEADNVKFAYADILKDMPKLKYDIIVSNPPYVSATEMQGIEPELGYEPQSALTDNSDGMEFYRRYVTIFKNILSIEGQFYLEINSSLGNEIMKMFEKDYKVELLKDISEKHRILKGRVC